MTQFGLESSLNVLKVNMKVLIVGSIVYDKHKGGIVLEDILWTARDTGHLEELMRSDNKLKLFLAGTLLLVSAVSAAAIYFLVTDSMARPKANLRPTARQIFSEMVERGEPDLPEEASERLKCVACTVNIKDVVSLPCHHVSCCLDCVERLESLNKHTCVMCKKQVAGVAHVFPQ